jgi:hypothetical protein
MDFWVAEVRPRSSIMVYDIPRQALPIVLRRNTGEGKIGSVAFGLRKAAASIRDRSRDESLGFPHCAVWEFSL